MAFTVVFVLSPIGAVYSVPVVALGVLPSVVYRIDAPAVVVLMVTVCAEVYVPAAGLNAGAATGGLVHRPIQALYSCG